MKTVQLVLDETLLRAADRQAKRSRVNRSELMRQALREHLKRLRIAELEARDRRGYQDQPACEFAALDGVASWPEE